MNGLIALVGSGEYLPVMEEVDRHLLASLNTNSHKPCVICLPTAAGKESDQSIDRWSTMGIRHFTHLGADVTALRILDRETANDETHASMLENADLIYFSGGDPGYLYETLRGTRAWNAAQRAWARGAVYAGCSAGAMILGRRMPSFRLAGTQEGFGLVPIEFVVPHFDAIPAIWKPVVFALQKQLKERQRMVGIDEDTALVGSLQGEWKVMGKGNVQVFEQHGKSKYQPGDIVPIVKETT